VLLSLAIVFRVQLLERWYLRRLGSSDFAARVEAAGQLVALSSERTIPVLVAFLREALESRALELEGVLFGKAPADRLKGNAEWTARLLLAAMREGGGQALGAAARSHFTRWLAEDGRQLASIVPALIDALSDREVEIRGCAVWALGRIGAAAGKATPYLIGLLDDAGLDSESLEMRQRAALSLAEIGAAATIPAIASRIDALGFDGVQALAGLTPESLPALFELLGHPENRIRQLAGNAFGYVEDPEVMSFLSERLRAADAASRARAAFALSRLEERAAGALPELIALLDDSSTEVCRNAARALGAMPSGAAESAPALVKLLRHEEPLLRREAILSLSCLPLRGAGVARELRRALEDPEPRLRALAASCLGRVAEAENEAVAGALAAALGDPHPDVTAHAAEALRFLGAQEGQAAALAGALLASPGQVRWRVARALATGGPRAAEALIRVLEDGDAEARRLAAWALGELGGAAASGAAPALARALDDPSEEVRFEAIGALGRLGSWAAEAAPRIAEALAASPSPPERSRLEYALERITGVPRPGGSEAGGEDRDGGPSGERRP
jgi:HEAT repeat protein